MRRRHPVDRRFLYGVFRLARSLLIHKGQDLIEIADATGLQTRMFYEDSIGPIPWEDIRYFAIDRYLRGDVLVAKLKEPEKYESRLRRSFWHRSRANVPPLLTVIRAGHRINIDVLERALDEMRRHALGLADASAVTGSSTPP